MFSVCLSPFFGGTESVMGRKIILEDVASTDDF